jgi:hypothetical protein
MSTTNTDVVIVNKTKKVLVLGKLVLKPQSSSIISKSEQYSPSILSAEQSGLIRIISDEKNNNFIQEIKIEDMEEVKSLEEMEEEKPEVVEAVNYIAPKSGEDKNVKPVVLDFREQVTKEAQKISKQDYIVDIKENDDTEDDVKENVVVKVKTTKKSSSKKNKKENGIKPVGEKRAVKDFADAAIELDSRGNVIAEKPSDIIKSLIDSIGSVEDIGFVDQEQAQEKLDKRNDII